MEYIDVEKLKRFVGDLKEKAKRNRCDSWGIVPEALEEVEGFITSLQQEQLEVVDLELELDNYYGVYRKDGKTYDIEDGEECVDWKELTNPYAEIDLARHFYELGKLNAKLCQKK